MQCPRCQHENPAGVKFCGECGAPLALLCPACRSSNPVGNKFCGECGAPLGGDRSPRSSVPLAEVVPTPLESKYATPQTYTPKHLAEKILTSKSVIEGERKGVTVMFADVSGFTAMSERLDPEDVHAIMDRAFEVILGEVHRYEGTINQFLGDGVMALFGAPISHEDHAHRALCAALAIQEGLKPLQEDVRGAHAIDFRVRIGINTGLVVVGAIGKDLRMDYTAVGDTTNLAARLLSVAKPGQVVVSRRTQHLREGFFEFEDLGEFQLKGKTEPVRAYALIREIRGRTRLEVSKERGLTPLVGREREIQRLTQAHQRAAAGEGAIALLEGDPGVGKSRLLYEFLRRHEGLGFLELETTGVSYGRSMPYRPILELVRRCLVLSEGVSGEEIRTRVGERLQLLGLDGDDGAILLAHFLGVSASQEFLYRQSAAQLKARTLDLLRDLFLRASESGPLALIVENVHWLDPSSEEFLAHLAAGLAHHRVLLVLSTRPGFAAPWLAPPLAETIRIEGLDPGEIEGMARSLLASERVSEQLLGILVARSEGNPLYVEEILHQLRETGGLRLEDREAGLRGAEVNVPATIQDIIAARVDRLAETLKRTLQGAAVVGRRFGISLLTSVLEASRDDVAGDLRELHGLDFIFPSAHDPELMYSFKHALTQEVVYAGILERRRRRHHAAAGVGLEALYFGRTGEVTELLAYHFGRSEEAEKAVDYAILAAEKAQRRWANTEALAYFDGALKRLGKMPDLPLNRLRRIDATVKQAEIKFALGQHAEHVHALEEIREVVESTAEPRRRASWYCWTGFLHSLTGARPELPIEYCQRAATIADTEGLDDLRAFAECCLTHVYCVAGRPREALAAGERALAIFEARGNIWWACRTLWGLSMAANASGLWARSLEYCRRGLEHGQAVNDLRLKVVGWWRTGSTHVQRGDPKTGLRCYEEALALNPIPFDAAMATAGRAYGLVKIGEVAAGMAQLAETVAWFARSNLHYTRCSWALRLAEGFLRQGERSSARAVLEDVLATSRELGYRHLEGWAARLLGEVLAPDDPSAAACQLELATRILEEVGAEDERAKALAAQGGLRQAAGDVAGARELLERAVTVFETLGTIDEAVRIRAALADLDSAGTRRLLIVSRNHLDG